MNGVTNHSRINSVSSTCDFVTKRNYRHFHVISQLTIDMSNIVYRHYLCEITTATGLPLDLTGNASMAFLSIYLLKYFDNCISV